MGGGLNFLLGMLLVLSWAALSAIGAGDAESDQRLAWMFFLILPPVACFVAWCAGFKAGGK